MIKTDTPTEFAAPAARDATARPVGVLLVNLGTPDATDYFSMRRYLKEFLSDTRVIEENRVKWWLILNLIILSVRPRRKGRDYRQDLEPGARRIAAPHHHAGAGGEAAAPAAERERAHPGRFCDALRQSLDSLAPRHPAAGGLRAHPDRPALSAICRRHDRDRLRQGVPVADDQAGAADDPRGAALVRRPGLYRGAGVIGRGGAGQALISLPT